jgi:hypothetical protein
VPLCKEDVLTVSGTRTRPFHTTGRLGSPPRQLQHIVVSRARFCHARANGIGARFGAMSTLHRISDGGLAPKGSAVFLPGLGSDPYSALPASSSTAGRIIPQAALRAKLIARSKSSPNTSPPNANKPPRKERELEEIFVADVLSIYADDCGPKGKAARKKFDRRIGRLNEFFGADVLASTNGERCRAYVIWRGNAGGSRRDIEDLRSAIDHHADEGCGNQEAERVQPCALSLLPRLLPCVLLVPAVIRSRLPPCSLANNIKVKELAGEEGANVGTKATRCGRDHGQSNNGATRSPAAPGPAA